MSLPLPLPSSQSSSSNTIRNHLNGNGNNSSNGNGDDSGNHNYTHSSNTSANTSQSQSLFADIGIQQQKLQQQKRRKKHKNNPCRRHYNNNNNHQHQKPRGQDQDEWTKKGYLSLHDADHGHNNHNVTKGINGAARQHGWHQQSQQNASLFGEIMKRTQWEQNRNEHIIENSNVSAFKAFKQQNDNDNENDNGNNDEPSIVTTFPSFKTISSSKARRSNIFKQEKQPCTNNRKRIDKKCALMSISESKTTTSTTTAAATSLSSSTAAPLSLLSSSEIPKNNNSDEGNSTTSFPLTPKKRYRNTNDSRASSAATAERSWNSSSPDANYNTNNDNDDNDNSDGVNFKTPQSLRAAKKKKINKLNPSSFQPDVINNRSNLYYREQHNNSPSGFSLKQLLDKCMSPNSNLQMSHGKKNRIQRSTDNDATFSPSSRLDGGLGQHSANGINSSDAIDTTDLESVEDDNWQEGKMRLPKYVIPSSQLYGSECSNNDSSSIDNSISKLSRGELNIIDWSIKKSLKIEYPPGMCIPGRPFSSTSKSQQRKFGHVHDQSKIERQAFALLTNHSKLDNIRENSEQTLLKEAEVLAQWQAGLMYWQHPSNHPLPSSILYNSCDDDDDKSNNTNNKISGVSRSVSNSRSNTVGVKSRPTTIAMDRKQHTSNISLSASVYGPHAKLKRQFMTSNVGCLGGLGKSFGDSSDCTTVSSNASMLEQREFEWQECFRSLFYTWMSQINELNGGMVDGGSLVDLSSRLYFYSVAPGTTILFRASVRMKDEESTHKDEVRPIIIISSSTIEMRSMLRSMGTQIRLLGGNSKEQKANGDINTVDENFIHEWFKEKIVLDSNIDESLQQELEELRRATFHGESVGAEVSFSHLQRKKRRNVPEKKASDFPPLLLIGRDDCMNFFELFLNTCGWKTSKLPWNKKLSNNDNTRDVPLLLCRSLGPTRHMTLRQLGVFSSNLSNEPGSKSDSEMFIRGPILPCAVQDLICATVSHFCLDNKQSPSLSVDRSNEIEEQSAENKTSSPISKNEIHTNDKEDKEGNVGSHYFAMYLHTHDGEGRNDNSSNANMKKFLGSATSASFNGFQESNQKNNDGDNNFSVRECNTDEVMSLAVWSINEPFGIAFECHSVKKSN